MSSADDLDLADAPCDPRALLHAGLERMGLPASDRQLDQLVRYTNEIELWNPRLKLVAAHGSELIVRHLLDSLAGWAALRRVADTSSSNHLADLGSGAGLPGIPVAVMEPALRVDLVERSGRRAGFLRNAAAALRLAHVRVVETDAERYEERPDLVVFRAFLPLTAALLTQLLAIVVPGGHICAYKGKLAAAQDELASAGTTTTTGGPAGGREQDVRIVPVEVPFLRAERHLVLIRRQ